MGQMLDHVIIKVNINTQFFTRGAPSMQQSNARKICGLQQCNKVFSRFDRGILLDISREFQAN